MAMFKNESWIIEEWIKHYLSEGVEHFYLIDNGSTDNFREKIKNYMKYITLISDPLRLPKIGTQTFLYNKYYLNKIKKETEWIIICDIDEYMYARRRFSKIIDFLKILPHKIQNIWIPWKLYGSNGNKNQPKSVISGFLKRKKDNNFTKDNGYGKTITKTNNLVRFGTAGHYNFVNDKIIYLPNGKPLNYNNRGNINEAELETFFIHINHYRLMSEEYYKQIKCKRGGGYSGHNGAGINKVKVYTLDFFKKMDKNFNTYTDDELLKKKIKNNTLHK